MRLILPVQEAQMWSWPSHGIQKINTSFIRGYNKKKLEYIFEAVGMKNKMWVWTECPYLVDYSREFLKVLIGSCAVKQSI